MRVHAAVARDAEAIGQTLFQGDLEPVFIACNIKLDFTVPFADRVLVVATSLRMVSVPTLDRV